MAAVIIVSCSKIDTAFEAPQEISFKAVAGNITKAPVSGVAYPNSLNLYVNAYTTDISSDAETPNYFINGEFTHKDYTINNIDVWGGVTPYYWPNVKKLHFVGFSKSGNATNTNATYSPKDDLLTIEQYSPGTTSGSGTNDLMYFPSTKLTNTNGYGADTEFVTVYMYHTCSWISFFVKGDNVTDDGSYSVIQMSMTDIINTADVNCRAEFSIVDNLEVLTPDIVWTNYSEEKNTYPINVLKNGVTLYTNARNVETGEAYSSSNKITGGNIVVIPQVPGKLNLTYKYGTTEKTVEDLDLTYATDSDGNSIPWQPGKHYIYTITIKANEILIAPSPVDWTDTDWNVTVE